MAEHDRESQKRPDDAAGVSGRDTGMEVPMHEQGTPRTADEDAARRGQCCEFCGAVTGLERYRPVPSLPLDDHSVAPTGRVATGAG